MNVLDPITWAILLMIVGCALVVLEVFVPSGGIIGFLAVTAVMASIIMAFYHYGPSVGVTFAGVAVILLPVSIALALKAWPHTAMGKRFLLGLPTEEEVLPDDQRRRELSQLVGKIGVAKSPMLPSGAVRIAGMTIDAMSEGMPVDVGQAVKVIEVHGYQVVVRPADESEIRASEKPEDLLAKPIDELGIEPLDDPLA